jgi:hypothetical protein
MKRIFPFLATNLAVLGPAQPGDFHHRAGIRRALEGAVSGAAVSSGLEITHVANGDMVTLALLQGVLNRKAE